jgi:hypothetical protein
MATINITDLHTTGADLFSDSESYLNELMDDELNLTHGGFTFAIPTSPVCAVALSVTVATFIGYTIYETTS